MQFAPGEVNIDQPVPGNYTIQRFSQPQTSASFTTGSQVSICSVSAVVNFSFRFSKSMFLR